MSPFLRRACLPILLGFLSLAPAWGENFSHVGVELLSEQTFIQPGGSVTVGFRFRMQQGWHLYWQNPGDSGMAPSVSWTLPEGFTAGRVLWPVPQRIALPSLADYGYKNEVMLMVPLTAPADAKPGRMYRLSARVRWLVCNDICIPGDKQLDLRLRVRKHKPTVNPRHAYLFEAARRSLPQDMPSDWKARGTLGPKEFHLSFETGSPIPRDATAVFFPLNPSRIENAAPQRFHRSGSSFTLDLRRSDQLLKNIPQLEGLVSIEEKSGEKRMPAVGYRVSIPLTAE